MRRLAAVIALVVLAVAAATIAGYPGAVDIVWQGWEINTSVGALIAALAILALVIWVALSSVVAAIRLPRRFSRERRRRLGELAVTRGIVALAAGDAGAAQRQANRAEALLGARPLPLMLAAQAARLNGDDDAARQRYTALLDQKDAAFFGLRGLIGQALRDGDSEDARHLAARALALHPNAGWAFETLLALQTRAGRWMEAHETLTAAARRRLLPAARAEHHRGIILYELSFVAEHEGDPRRAMSLAASARRLVADLAAPTVRHARLLIAENRRRAARRVVVQAWRQSPHPELARLWGELGAGAAALQLVTWFEKLAAENPDSVESAVAVAEAALAAQLWGEARRHLDRAIAAAPLTAPRRLYLTMARVEDSEHPGQGRAREWYDRALVALPDPTYICGRCGAESGEWRSLCGHCQCFDTLAWRTPAQSGTMIAAPAAILPGGGEPTVLLPDGLASAAQSAR